MPEHLLALHDDEGLSRAIVSSSGSEPSAPSTTGPMDPGAGAAVSSAAPAPSPNSAAVRRSSKSV
jgi:hypothetical protein